MSLGNKFISLSVDKLSVDEHRSTLAIFLPGAVGWGVISLEVKLRYL